MSMFTTDGAVSSVSLLVPADRIGKVIGKQGAGLRSIREASGLKVHVPACDDPNEPVRRVDLSGASEQLSQGFMAVLEKAYHDVNIEDVNAAAMMLPADRAGYVVGKGGQNLHRIRTSTNVDVKVEKEIHIHPETSAEERYLSMHGNVEEMCSALLLITGGGSLPASAPVPPKPVFEPPPPPSRPSAKPNYLANGAAPARPVMQPSYPANGAASGGPAQTLSNIFPIGAEPEEVQLHMKIPEQFAGALIGKGGAQVKNTAQTAGCKVIASDRNAGERRIVMVGHFSRCIAAQDIVYQQLVDAASEADEDIDEVSVIFLIRKEAAGSVIGKQGDTLRQIRESTGCRIQLTKDEVAGHRLCTISGTYPNLLQAEKLVFERVRVTPVDNPGAVPEPAFAAMPVYAGGAPAMMPPRMMPIMPMRPPVSNSAFAGGAKRALPFNTGYEEAPMARDVKRQRVDDSATPTKLLVPSDTAGAVIGRQASALKQLRDTYSVMVEVLKAQETPQFPEDRVVLLHGEVPARCRCIEGVLRLAFPQGECQLKMMVPANKAGYVIGKQAATLKSLRDTCGINVQVERDEIHGERLVAAAGPISQVTMAAAYVVLLVEGEIAGGQNLPPLPF